MENDERREVKVYKNIDKVVLEKVRLEIVLTLRGVRIGGEERGERREGRGERGERREGKAGLWLYSRFSKKTICVGDCSRDRSSRLDSTLNYSQKKATVMSNLA